jgi:WD40 repeat protein
MSSGGGEFLEVPAPVAKRQAGCETLKLEVLKLDQRGSWMRFSFRLMALLSVLSFALLPADSSAQQRRRPGPAQDRGPQVKVLPIGVVGNFSNPEDAQNAIFSPDSKIVALIPYSSGVTLWDAGSGRPLRSLTQRPYFTASAFSEDGRQMVTGHKDGTVRIWDIETGSVTQPAAPRGKSKTGKVEDPEPIRTVWVDPRGELFVTSDGGGAVTIWSLTSKKPVLTVPNRSATPPLIHEARIAPDGQTLIVLASKSYKGIDTVTSYDARNGAQMSSYDLPEKHNFVDNGIVRQDEAIVLYSSPECERGELVLFSLKDKSVIVPVYRPANCARPKDGEAADEPRIFHGPDSTRLLIAQEGDPELRIFDVATRRMTNTIRWPGVAKPQLLGVSGDMRLIASKEPDGIAIRNLDDGKPVKELRSFATYSDAMVLNANATQILVQRSGPQDAKAAIDVSLWKIEDPKPVVLKLPGGTNIRIRDFSSVAMTALSGSDDGELALVPLDGKGKPRKLVVPQLRSLKSARLSPDGKLALLRGEFTKSSTTKPGTKPDDESVEAAILLDTADGKLRQKFETSNDAFVTGFAFSPDGAQFALGLRNGGAEIWDSASARKIKALPPAKEDADTHSIAFSPDGRMLIGAGMFDDDVFVWNIETGKIQRIYKMPNGLAGYRYATSVATSRDRKTIAAGLGQRAMSSGDIGTEHGGILLWDADTGKLRTTLRSQRGAITALAFSANDKWIVSGSLDGTIQYWDRATGKPLATAVAGPNGRWIVMTEAGVYTGSEGSGEAVNVVRGLGAASGPAVAKILSRPDLVEMLFKGDTAKYQDAVKKLDLPSVAP